MTAIPRRTVLTALALGLTTVAGCGNRTYRGPQRTLTVAAGERGGLYLPFAELLATQIREEEPRLRATAVPTKGGLDNLQRLGDGTVDLAVVNTDAAQAASGIGGPLAAPVPLRAIGRVYENYLQLVVLATSPIRTLADLAGRTVSLGAAGAGAELTGDRLLTAVGLTPTGPPATVIKHYPISDAITELDAGRIDALFWSGGVPTPALAELSARRGIRLLPLATALAPLRAAHGPVYDLVTVPAGAYGAGGEIPTIGVANLLLCRPDTDPAVTATVARVLVTRAARLVPQQALGTQFLDPRSLIVTGGVALHPGAITAYRALHG